jgi:hypothetical protein
MIGKYYDIIDVHHCITNIGISCDIGCQPAVDADDPPGTRRRQPRPTLPLVEATAVGLYLIGKVYRPEFDVRGAPDRDRAVPGLHSAVFGSRLQ